MSWIQRFRANLKQHGWLPGVIALATLGLSRGLNLHLCKVAWGSTKTYPPIHNYPMAMVAAEEFAQLADPERVAEFAPAFAKGDQCAVTLHHGELAGYNFFARSHTSVNAAVVFQLGPDMLYSYAAYTHPAHRGLGLSPARWTFAAKHRADRKDNGQAVIFIQLDNLPSLYSGGKGRNKPIGYSAYWMLGKGAKTKAWCFRSPGCKRLGVGFQRVAAN